jgi:hypothetical protein
MVLGGRMKIPNVAAELGNLKLVDLATSISNH